MSIASKFKTDPKAVTDGAWVEFEPNSDGSIPAVKLTRQSTQNKKYMKAMRKVAERFTDHSGKIDFDSTEELSEASNAAFLDILINVSVVDWKNIQPCDDGVELEYTPANAGTLLRDPAWTDFAAELRAKATDIAAFRAKVLEAHTKN